MDVLAGLRAERFEAAPATASSVPEGGGYRVIAGSGEVYELAVSVKGRWCIREPGGAVRCFTLSDEDEAVLNSPLNKPEP